MDIKDIVDSQIKLLNELNTLLDDEKEFLMNDDAEKIAVIVESKKDIAQKIAILEKNRQSLYGDKKASEFVQEGILKQELIDNFIKLTNEIHEKNETNMILTKQSINYIRVVSNILNPRPKVVTYGSNGRIDGNSFSGFNREV